MIGEPKDVLLAYVNGSDTVNDWRNKTNALIHYINTMKPSDAPSIPFSDVVPSNESCRLWFDTSTMTLMTWFEGAWRQFHHVYAYELKFYQKSIKNNKTIPIGFNAVAVSPTVEPGVTIEVSEGSVMRII